jgi:DNA-binding transcriptional regulator/RsmH inhibitor MraZ
MPPGFMDLFGTFDAKVDLQSGRVSLPTDFTSLKGAQVMVTTEPLKRYLEVRNLEEFTAFQQRMRRKADDLPAADAIALRVNYLGTSVLAQVDNTFRLVLPKRSREVLGGRGDVVLVGIGDCVQVWLADQWARQHGAGDEVLQGGYDSYAGEIHRMAPVPSPSNVQGA